jgi:hypothetical protein
MTYSYTQISQYLGCPRRYRHRYLDGWQEKDQRAAMLFGRVFEKALAAFFRRQDATAALYEEWGRYQGEPLEYRNGDSWERMLRQGVQLLERLAQDNRIRIRQPRRNLQLRLDRRLANGSQFVAYIDAVGHLDGTRRLLEWKTTSSRYSEEPDGNCFAILGSAELKMWPWWPSFASAFPRFSTTTRKSAQPRERASGSWWKTPSTR